MYILEYLIEYLRALFCGQFNDLTFLTFDGNKGLDTYSHSELMYLVHSSLDRADRHAHYFEQFGIQDDLPLQLPFSQLFNLPAIPSLL